MYLSSVGLSSRRVVFKVVASGRHIERRGSSGESIPIIKNRLRLNCHAPFLENIFLISFRIRHAVL